MLSRKLIIAGALVVVLVGAVGVVTLFDQTDFVARIRGSEEGGNNASNLARKETLTEETDAYIIKMTYPQFGIPAIDDEIKKGVDFLAEDFKSQVMSISEEGRYEISSSFDGVYVSDDVISAHLAVSSYLGGAHPNFVIYGLNFDPKTNKQISLKGALSMIGHTLPQVAERSRQILSEQLGGSFFPEGVETKDENFRTFSINADTVTFIFDPYQVAPFSEGPQGVAFERVKK